MNKLLTFLLLSFCLSSYAQQSILVRDTVQVNIDSLNKRIQKLEHNQTLIMLGLHEAGGKIRGGAIILGIGFLTSIAGSVLVAVIQPTPPQRIAPGQIIGAILGTVGIGMSIGGAFSIGAGGKRLKEL